MTPSQKSACHRIIHTSSVSGAGVAAGMAQIPLADIPVLQGIEITMVINLGGVFGIDVGESTAKSLIVMALGTIAGRGISQALIGWVPGIGNAINAATAAALIESLGWAIAKDFGNRSNR